MITQAERKYLVAAADIVFTTELKHSFALTIINDNSDSTIDSIISRLNRLLGTGSFVAIASSYGITNAPATVMQLGGSAVSALSVMIGLGDGGYVLASNTSIIETLNDLMANYSALQQQFALALHNITRLESKLSVLTKDMGLLNSIGPFVGNIKNFTNCIFAHGEFTLGAITASSDGTIEGELSANHDCATWASTPDIHAGSITGNAEDCIIFPDGIAGEVCRNTTLHYSIHN